jgi:hypothetical protein
MEWGDISFVSSHDLCVFCTCCSVLALPGSTQMYIIYLGCKHPGLCENLCSAYDANIWSL